MNFLKLTFVRLRSLFRRAPLERDMAEEMAVHLEMQEEANRARGMDAEEARYAAQRQFGGVAQVQERCREQRGWVWLEQLGKDFLLAGRTLRKNRVFSAVAIVTLALGIAATASLFSVVNGLLRDPLPYPDPGRLTTLRRHNVDAALDVIPLSTSDVLDLQERAQSFADLGAFSVRRFNLGGEHAEGVEGALCTAGLFRALGVQPLYGRWFLPEDEAGDGTAAVILSHALWQQRFGADPKCIGRTIRLDGRDHTIVGVMPEGFAVLTILTRTRPLALWSLLPLRRNAGDWNGYWLFSIARLRPGVTSGQASEEVKTIARLLVEENPSRDQHKTIWSIPLAVELGGLPVLRISALMAAGWTLLVLAAQNVAGMMLARGIGRQPEMAVRMALGARRGHILRLVLMESLLLSLLASIGGFLLTLWGQWALTRLLPAEVMPRAGLHVDAWLLGSVAVLTLIATQMAGLAPALLASKTDVVGGIKEGGASSGPARKTQRKLRNLVIGQIATALLLLSVALQLSGTYRAMLGSSRALVSDTILTASVAVKGPAYRSEETRVEFWRRFLERCGALPGVCEAAVASQLPLEGGVSSTVLIDDEAYNSAKSYPWIAESFVSPGFFQAIGTRLIQGRLLSPADEAGRAQVVVINRAMARSYWPGRDPIGRRIRPAQPGQGWAREVVGVVEDVRQVAERSAGPEMYFPFADAAPDESFLVMRMATGLPAPVEAVRQELGRIDGDLALANVRTLGAMLQSQGRVLDVITSVLDVLTVAIVGLAALGLYGTLSFYFARRRRDIGVRLALGATPRDIVRLMLKQAAVWVVAGLGVGAAGAWLCSSVLRRVLDGASPFDGAGVALGAALVFGVALLAAWLPARRAMQVDPVEALRAE
jgi:putative ABC transport system permease protein